jgi:excisionase family DNA binding protein
MSPLFGLDNFPAIRAHRAKQAMWEASLTQETYTVAEAAEAMRLSKKTVRELLDSGELYSENPGARATRIPKAAIIRYMAGPGPLEGLFGKTSE